MTKYNFEMTSSPAQGQGINPGPVRAPLSRKAHGPAGSLPGTGGKPAAGGKLGDQNDKK